MGDGPETPAVPETGGDSPESSPVGSARPVPSRLFGLRRTLPSWQVFAFAMLSLVVFWGLWSFVTAGPVEERIVGPSTLPSPGETFGEFKTLWFDGALTRNTFVTVRRVVLGFLLAALVGIPLGILCGCFGPVRAFFMPLTIFGRNIPLAALIPLTFAFFGLGEQQKVMFIFIACVMFVTGDTAQAIRDVEQRYLDTAYTLGASRRQVILKVLTPLAMPNVFNSLRLLFGLAFGYIMLAELVTLGGEAGGLGRLISVAQRRGQMEWIFLIIIIIPLLAFGIDRLLHVIQRGLFPHRYGGSGWLNRGVRSAIHAWEDLKAFLWQRRRSAMATQPSGHESADTPEEGGEG